MHLQIVNPINDTQWDELVLNTPGHTFFHTAAWARVLAESYPYAVTYFTSMEGDRLLAFLPVMNIKSVITGRRGVSLPFTDYCDPLVSDQVKFQEVFDSVIQYGRQQQWNYFEIRGGETHLPAVTPYTKFLGHTLALSPDEGRLSSKLRDSTRRNIRKAILEGVNVGIHHSWEAVLQFYRLNCMTRREHGLPPQPINFFKNVYKHIIAEKAGLVVLASYQGINIAGGVFFHAGKEVIYKYGASDRRFQNLRANNLVMWEAIKWYGCNCYNNFSFGRTETDHHGLRQFKMGWGAKEYAINYYRYQLKTGAFIKYEGQTNSFSNKVMQKMPIPLLRLVGLILYKHMG
jgi:hypothetical protein